MSQLRVATLAAILAGSLLGATAAAWVVPAWIAPPAPPPAPRAGSLATPPTVGGRGEAATGHARPVDTAPGSTSATPETRLSPSPLEFEGPLPAWLEGPLPAEPGAVDAAALRCARGDAIDCMRVGDAYEQGRGVPIEPRQARLNRSAGTRLFETACRRRDAAACYYLSVAHALGQGVAASPANAQSYLERARALCQVEAAPICERFLRSGAE